MKSLIQGLIFVLKHMKLNRQRLRFDKLYIALIKPLLDKNIDTNGERIKYGIKKFRYFCDPNKK